MKKLITDYWPFLLAAIIYSWFAFDLNFTQDDAYISYRVVQYFLDGHGLVFNVGEYVEGFTNFGWVIYMILVGALGFGYIAASKVTGYLCGVGIIFVTHRLSLRILGERSTALAWLPTLLVGLNMSLAYWSPAGLETAAFGLFALLSLYWYLTRNHLLIWSLLMAVWMRPEGALVTGLVLVADAIEHRRFPRFSLTCAAVAFGLSLPMVAFKLGYYGGILPNPFYAKTGMSIAQLTHGLDYTWRFLSHYGAFGLGVLLPVIFWKKLTRTEKSVWLFMLLYTCYIVLVGGDVLSVHRFFVPLMGPSALLIALGFWLLIAAIKLTQRTRLMIYLFLGIALAAGSLILPREFVQTYNKLEKRFTSKMSAIAHSLDQTDASDFSVALPTIGIFSYELPGHRVIDMLGLTDSTIARHPEPPIDGIESTWKESHYNNRYLLEQAPDYILFSTGLKPSAPAERVLMLYPQFLHSYRSVGWYIYIEQDKEPRLQTAFKRMRPVDGAIAPSWPIAWVNNYKRGLDRFNDGDYREAVNYLREAYNASRQPYYPYLLYMSGFSYLMLGDPAAAKRFYDTALESDSLVWEVHQELLIFAYANNDTTAIRRHREAIDHLVPWLLPRADSIARGAVGTVKQ